jgi:hypothetical protein
MLLIHRLPDVWVCIMGLLRDDSDKLFFNREEPMPDDRRTELIDFLNENCEDIILNF